MATEPTLQSAPGLADYMTAEEAMARLGISRPTLMRRVRDGLLGQYRTGRNRTILLFLRAQVDALAEVKPVPVTLPPIPAAVPVVSHVIGAGTPPERSTPLNAPNRNTLPDEPNLPGPLDPYRSGYQRRMTRPNLVIDDD